MACARAARRARAARGSLSPGRRRPEPIDQRLVDPAVLRLEAGDAIAEVRAVELRVGDDLAREEALSQRAEPNEADPQLLQGRQHFLLGLAVPERVLAPHGGDRLDRVCASDGLGSGLGQPEVLDLALLNQVLHRSRHVLDRDLGVHTVLVVPRAERGAPPPRARRGTSRSRSFKYSTNGFSASGTASFGR